MDSTSYTQPEPKPMAENARFAVPGFAFSLAHLTQGGDAETRCFSPGASSWGDLRERSSAGVAQQGWTSPASPGRAASPLWQPQCLLVY